jgi:hypothetical protein
LAGHTSVSASVNDEQGENKIRRFLDSVGQLAAVSRVNEDLDPMVRDDQVEHEIADESETQGNRMERGALFDFVRIGGQSPDKENVTG